MAELADAHDSGSCVRTYLQVQVLFPAPNQCNPNRFFSIGDGFGLFIIFTPEQIAAVAAGPLDFPQVIIMDREVAVEDPMVTLTEHPAPDGSFEVVAVNNSRSDKTVALHWNDAFELTGCLCGTLQGDRLSLEAHSGAILTFGRKA